MASVRIPSVMASSNTSNCRLCGETRALCKSHILPEFVYRGIYDEHHTFAEFSGTAGERNRRHRKGIWERLLCIGCERAFQEYEDYACKLIFDNPTVVFPRVDGDLIVDGIDYLRLELFQLSLLWRASVSTQRMFRHVKLGPYEEVLRKVLLAGSRVHPGDFSCTMEAIVDRGSHLKELLMEVAPMKTHTDRSTLYPFVFGGYYTVFLARTGISNPPAEISLTENRLRIGQIDVSVVPGLFDLFARASVQGKFRHFERAAQDEDPNYRLQATAPEAGSKLGRRGA